MIKKINGMTRREYEKLKEKYNKLKKKYDEVKSRKINLIFAIATYIIGSAFFIRYRHPVIIEAGVLLLIVGLAVELHGTKKGSWDYTDSLYMIRGRFPIEIALQYFFCGMIAAGYYFLRTQSYTGFIL